MLRTASKAGADWAGFVLVPASPRNILGASGDRFAMLRRLVDLSRDIGIGSAVLMVDPDAELFVSGEIEPDAIQLHGGETPQQVAGFRAAAGEDTEIWKSLGVESRADIETAASFGAADRLLMDAKPPRGADRTGGHGAAFDWALLHGWRAPRLWMLAGGLTPDNVAAAIAATGAAAVDVSSGVERERGVKDEALIRKFVAAAKAA